MSPDFTLSIAGADRTSVLKSRLLSLRLTTSTGKEADEIELEFDDRDNAITLPTHGAVATVAIGYVGLPLVPHGSFTVDETNIEGLPEKVTVKAKSSDMRSSLKAHKSRAWRAMTTGQIVAQIASEHGLQPQVHPDLAPDQVEHLDQANESDLHFLTRHGQHHDAIASVKGGKLIFAPKGAASSASGRTLPPLMIVRSNLTGWRKTNSDREKHGSVRGRHHDYTAAVTAYVETGSDEPVRTLRHAHSSAALAGHHAHARHRHGKRKANGVELDLPGTPDAFAGRPVVVSGVRAGIDGRWIIAKAEHEQTFGSGGGYTTKLTVTVDGKLKDGGDGTPSYGGDDADPTDTGGGTE